MLFNQKFGYTVIETVVYVALVASMLIISTNAILSTYRAFGVLRVERQISLNGDAAIETMIRDIRAATSTTIGSSMFLSNPGTLRLNAIRFSLNGTVLQKNDGANPTQNITGNDVRVISLIFYRDATTTTDIISARMTIEDGQGRFVKSKQYYGSAVLRGGYK